MVFIPAANAKTYSDKRLDIRYTIPDKWEIVPIPSLQELIAGKNVSKSIIDQINSVLDIFRKNNCTYIIVPNVEDDIIDSYLAIFYYPVINKDGETID